MGNELLWGEWRPDVRDLDEPLTASINNCIPRADGYGPIPSISALTSSLPGQCRGYFVARKVIDNTVVMFAGTATKLYKLNNGSLTWVDVSQGGASYTSLNVDANWDFAQFNNFVIATQINSNPQKFDITADTAFSDVLGTPPKSAYVSVINRFAVLGCTQNNPNRINWSGLNDITNWTSGVGSSDFQDLPDGGLVRGIVGGELGIIIQDAAIRSMTFSPGSDVIFNIFKLTKDLGALAPFGIVNIGNRIFFPSPMGFVQTDTVGNIQMIGQEKIDRTFLADLDTSNLQLCIGAGDPANNVVYWIYKSKASSTAYADKGLIYHYLLQRWAPFTANLEFIDTAIKPGLTLDGLDAVAPGAQAISNCINNGSGLIRVTVGSTSGWSTNDSKTITQVTGTTEANGTWKITVIDGFTIDLQGSAFVHAYVSGGFVGGSLDAMTVSLDALATVVTASLSGFSTSHTLGLFTGSNQEATFESPEDDMQGERILIQGFRPISDAPSIYGSVSYRENLFAPRTYTSEVHMNQYGYCATLRSTRYRRLKVRIPTSTNWSYSAGIQIDEQGDGEA